MNADAVVVCHFDILILYLYFHFPFHLKFCCCVSYTFDNNITLYGVDINSLVGIYSSGQHFVDR